MMNWIPELSQNKPSFPYDALIRCLVSPTRTGMNTALPSTAETNDCRAGTPVSQFFLLSPLKFMPTSATLARGSPCLSSGDGEAEARQALSELLILTHNVITWRCLYSVLSPADRHKTRPQNLIVTGVTLWVEAYDSRPDLGDTRL